MREQNQVQFRVSKVLKLEFSAHASKEIAPPARWQTHMLPTTTTTTAATTFPCRVSAAESRKTPERHEAPANRQWGRWKADRAEPSDVLPSLLFPKIGIIPRSVVVRLSLLLLTSRSKNPSHSVKAALSWTFYSPRPCVMTLSGVPFSFGLSVVSEAHAPGTWMDPSHRGTVKGPVAAA